MPGKSFISSASSLPLPSTDPKSTTTTAGWAFARQSQPFLAPLRGQRACLVASFFRNSRYSVRPTSRRSVYRDGFLPATHVRLGRNARDQYIRSIQRGFEACAGRIGPVALNLGRAKSQVWIPIVPERRTHGSCCPGSPFGRFARRSLKTQRQAMVWSGCKGFVAEWAPPCGGRSIVGALQTQSQ